MPGARASCPPKRARARFNPSPSLKLELRRVFFFAPLGAQGGQGCPRSRRERTHSFANRYNHRDTEDTENAQRFGVLCASSLSSVPLWLTTPALRPTETGRRRGLWWE